MEEEYERLGWHILFSLGITILLLISICLGGTGFVSIPKETKITSFLYGLSLFNIIISFIGLFVISRISLILMRRIRNRGILNTIIKLVSEISNLRICGY